MSNFRFIAIRALKECHKDFRKNLVEGEFYQFYDQYDILNEQKELLKNSESVFNVKLREDIVNDLYNINTRDGRAMAINISAVAGRNGSGKSTLAELFFAVMYLFSIRSKLLEGNEEKLTDELEAVEEEIRELKGKSPEEIIYGKIAGLLRYRIIKKNPSFEVLRTNFRNYEETKQQHFHKISILEKRSLEIMEELKEIRRLSLLVRAEIIFQASNTIFSVAVHSDMATGYEIRKVGAVAPETDSQILELLRDIALGKILDVEHFMSELFFYTIAVNYSNYSLNSNIIGSWITSLFHKNDGYKTPVVINPMRTDGRFNINQENRFAKYRLLSNLLSNCKSVGENKKMWLTEMQSVKTIHFNLNERKIKEYLIEDTGLNLKGKTLEMALITQLYQQFISDMEIGEMRSNSGVRTFKLVSNYLLQKIRKICNTYSGFTYPNSEEEVDGLVKKIKEDNTHITFKIRQAVNFIIHNSKHKGKQKSFFNLDNELVDFVEFSPSELLDWMESPEYGDIINHLPPSFFSINIELSSKTDEPSFFDLMSSGEQQFIHVVQSVLYHIINLQSVSGSSDRLSYKALNIVFDEVELYFHPDLQRKFIQELRTAIGNLYLIGASGVKAINILFLTHSPFILSDIPKSNVLLLDRNEYGMTITRNNESETFAANINDLLADNFFLEETLIGAFADQKIEDLIRKIDTKDYEQSEIELVNLIGDSYLKASINNFIKNND